MTHAYRHPSTRVVFDIETSGRPFEDLDEKQQQYLTRFASSEQEIEQEKLKVNLYPYTAEVVCIGMLNVDSGRSRILIQAPPGASPWTSDDGTVEFIPGDESQILRCFWEWAPRYEQLISFNGRAFDAPFLHVRSAILRVPATRNLLPYRYESTSHCDLLEQLTHHNATRKFSLDFICLGFGIESPKRQGVTGLDVNELHRGGQYREIAEYNHRDLLATCELFLRWEEFMQVRQS